MNTIDARRPTTSGPPGPGRGVSTSDDGDSRRTDEWNKLYPIRLSVLNTDPEPGGARGVVVGMDDGQTNGMGAAIYPPRELTHRLI